MSTPRYPALFQVNTRVRLSELAAALGRKATLDDIPDAELDRLAADGFDLVWFLGVWQTGEAARRVSRVEARVARRVPPRPPRLPRGGRLRLLLRGPGLPGPRGLRRRRGARPAPRAAEASRPAPHPRLRPEPHGAGPPLGERAPGLLRVGDGGAARRAAAELLPRRTGPGRAHPGLRARPLLRRLAGHAPAELRQPGPPGGDARRAAAHRAPVRRRPLRHGDARPAGGLRADLGDLRPPVLAAGDGGRPREGRRASSSSPRSTGTSSGPSSSRASTTPTTSGSTTAWRRATPARSASTSSPGLDFQDHLARFLENHDEPRAAATFAPEVHRAAAILTFLTPGLRFFHQGQREGKRVRIPVHLGRGPDEAPDAGDRRLLRRPPGVPEGPGLPRRRLAAPRVPSRLGRERDVGLLRGLLLDRPGRQRRLVAVNYADHQSQCYVAMPWRDLDGRDVAPPGPHRAVRLRPPGRRPDLAGPLPRHARVGLPRVRRLARGVSHRC